MHNKWILITKYLKNKWLVLLDLLNSFSTNDFFFPMDLEGKVMKLMKVGQRLGSWVKGWKPCWH